MLVLGARVHSEIGQLPTAERSAWEHALNRLLDYPLGIFSLHYLAGGAVFDAADIASVPVVDLVLELVARQQDLCRVDDDDVIAAIHMRRERRLVLAAKTQRDQRGEPSDDEAVRVDQDPLLFDLGRL